MLSCSVLWTDTEFPSYTLVEPPTNVTHGRTLSAHMRVEKREAYFFFSEIEVPCCLVSFLFRPQVQLKGEEGITEPE